MTGGVVHGSLPKDRRVRKER